MTLAPQMGRVGRDGTREQQFGRKRERNFRCYVPVTFRAPFNPLDFVMWCVSSAFTDREIEASCN